MNPRPEEATPIGDSVAADLKRLVDGPSRLHPLARRRFLRHRDRLETDAFMKALEGIA